LLLGSFLALRHALPPSSPVNNTDAYPGEFIPNGQQNEPTKPPSNWGTASSDFGES
jgi:hypothetical protein